MRACAEAASEELLLDPPPGVAAARALSRLLAVLEERPADIPPGWFAALPRAAAERAASRARAWQAGCADAAEAAGPGWRELDEPDVVAVAERLAALDLLDPGEVSRLRFGIRNAAGAPEPRRPAQSRCDARHPSGRAAPGPSDHV